jgi:hypothetical protein
MNERITALIIQTLGKEGVIASRAFGHWALTDDDLEKFTELIVRECAEIATKNQYEDCYAGYYVLQEFGIDY